MIDGILFEPNIRLSTPFCIKMAMAQFIAAGKGIPEVLNCPSDIRTSVEVGVSSVPVYWNVPFAFDGSGRTSVIYYRSHESGQLFPVNVTNVSYVFGDDVSKQAFCNFSVTVDQGMYL